MDPVDPLLEILSITSFILLLLLSNQRSLDLPEDVDMQEYVDGDPPFPHLLEDATSTDVPATTFVAWQHFQLWNTFLLLDEDLGYWVRPRSTTWFTRFLMQEYEDARWIQMFRMTKRAVISLAELLAPYIRKKDTPYRMAVLVIVRVACTLFKLSHGSTLLVCSKLFVVGRSTASMMLRQVVRAINEVLKSEIQWPSSSDVSEVAAKFQQLCGLPGIVGAIDGTHFPISKPKYSPTDYYYFKSGGYSVACQAVVDSSKRFLDINVGMPGSTNDARILRRSTLYYRGQRNELWDPDFTFSGFSPYLVGDAGYPLLPWLMVPHRQQGTFALADALFNRRLSKGRVVVEHAFVLLKQSFKELHRKSELDLTFFPNVVVCCAILHNILLKQSHGDVEALLEVLHNEGAGEAVAASAGANEGTGQAVAASAATTPCTNDGVHGPVANDAAMRKRSDLGVFMSLQRLTSA